MGIWLTELRRNLPSDIVLHVVGTKADIVTREPSRREVPFERCIAYVAENLAPGVGSTPPPTATPMGMLGYTGDGQRLLQQEGSGGILGSQPQSAEPRSPSSKRSSGFWGQEVGWDACHEISAESGEGVEEVFRVVTRKLVEQSRKKQQGLLAATASQLIMPGSGGGDGSGGGRGGDGSAGAANGYFDGANPGGSFRVGRDRRSWLFSPSVSVDQPAGGGDQGQGERAGKAGRRCC